MCNYDRRGIEHDCIAVIPAMGLLRESQDRRPDPGFGLPAQNFDAYLVDAVKSGEKEQVEGVRGDGQSNPRLPPWQRQHSK
jgi:hypothetical protein